MELLQTVENNSNGSNKAFMSDLWVS